MSSVSGVSAAQAYTSPLRDKSPEVRAERKPEPVEKREPAEVGREESRRVEANRSAPEPRRPENAAANKPSGVGQVLDTLA